MLLTEQIETKYWNQILNCFLLKYIISSIRIKGRKIFFILETRVKDNTKCCHCSFFSFFFIQRNPQPLLLVRIGQTALPHTSGWWDSNSKPSASKNVGPPLDHHRQEGLASLFRDGMVRSHCSLSNRVHHLLYFKSKLHEIARINVGRYWKLEI